jgi:hypothetical protein
MRDRIMGAIGVVWGGGSWVSYMAQGAPSVTNSDYAVGRGLGLVFAALLLLTGLYYLLRVKE